MLLDIILEKSRLLTLAVAGVGLISLGVMAQDDPPPDAETEEADEGNAAWDDPERLAETLAPDQTEEREALQELLDLGPDNGGISQEEFDAAIADLDAELASLDELIAALSPEQLYALNKFLNDTHNNGRGINLGAEELQLIIDQEYGDREIRLLTKALEEEYKFTQFAGRAAAKAEASGNDKFLDQEQRFLDRADAQRDKFLDRIEDDAEGAIESSLSGDVEDLTKGEIKRAAKDEVRQNAKDEVRGQVKAAAKREARDAAKDAAKNN